MDTAIQVFLVTAAIITGILSPVIAIVLLNNFGQSLKAISSSLLEKAEEIKKLPPFDDVELNLNPSTKILTGRILKDGKVLWQGSVTQKDID